MNSTNQINLLEFMRLFCILLVVLVSIALAQHDHGGGPNTQFNRCKNIKGFAKLEWRVSSHYNNITMKISFENAGRGWGGIGFNEAGHGMDGASMIVSHGSCDIFGCQVNEYLGRDMRQPLPDNRTILQGQGKFKAKSHPSSIHAHAASDRSIYETIDPSYLYDIKQDDICVVGIQQCDTSSWKYPHV
jgi:hypothetical protein